MDTGTPRTAAWLLMGATGSTPGVLELVDGRLRYTAHGRGALTGGQLADLESRLGRPGLADDLTAGAGVVLFDVPLAQVGDVVFPWYYFGGGMKLTAGGVGHRFSFLRPQNTQELPGVADIPAGRAAGRTWKKLLTGAGTGR